MCSQTRFHDVAPSTDAFVQHDPKVAAARNLQLRVPHVPEHDRRWVHIRSSFSSAFTLLSSARSKFIGGNAIRRLYVVLAAAAEAKSECLFASAAIKQTHAAFCARRFSSDELRWPAVSPGLHCDATRQGYRCNLRRLGSRLNDTPICHSALGCAAGCSISSHIAPFASRAPAFCPHFAQRSRSFTSVRLADISG